MAISSLRLPGILITLLLAVSISYAGTTGKVAGRVISASSGEPLVGVNVVVENTPRGSSTDLDGYYFIINLSPGTYVLNVTSLGFASQVIENVVVKVDQTTTVDIRMEESIIEGEVVTVVAKRPIIEVDRTFSTSSIASQDMEVMPVTNTNEVIELQAGVVDGHFRGGRGGEVVYMLDGIAIQDVYDNTQSTQVNQSAVEELQVITGSFNAEYGQAMSGVVNLVTKEGGNEYHGSFSAQMGDFFSNNSEEFDNITDINPAGIMNFEGSLNGPVPLTNEKLKFFANARYQSSDGWIYGRRKFEIDFVDTYIDMIIERERLGLFGREDWDDSTKWNDAISPAENYVNMLELYGLDDNEPVSMNDDENIYLFGKLSYQLTPTMKVNYTSLFENRDYHEFDALSSRDYLNIPEADYNRFRRGRTNNLKLVTTLSQSAFIDVGYSNNYTEYFHYVYEDLYDSLYYFNIPELSDLEPSYTLNVGGARFEHFRRYTDTHVAQAKLAWQVTPIHYVQTGFNLNFNEVFYRNLNDDVLDIGPTLYYHNLEQRMSGAKETLLPVSDFNHDHYRYKPFEMAFFVQDKIELKSLVVNAGLRLDYFDSKGKVLAFPNDPDVYHPSLPEHEAMTEAERLAIWYNDPSPKVQISPRLGIGYPISPTGVLHFAYGHFFQRPKYEYLYTNPEFELEFQSTGVNTVMGNADLEAEKTVSYEFGFNQALTPDISMGISLYQRDIRGLISADKIVDTGNNSGIKYAQYINRDVAEVRGIVLTFDKRYSNNVSFGLDYTYQIAEGVASDPQDAYNAQRGSTNNEPVKQLIPLDWDRRHTLNLNVNYVVPNNWGASVIGTIGSGLPYTIDTGSSKVKDLGVTFENDGRRPTYMNMDMTLFKDVTFMKEKGYKLRFELKVRNVFDRLNENDVHKDTGRATYRTDIPEDRTSERPSINTFDEYFLYHPNFYSRPREVRFGISFQF